MVARTCWKCEIKSNMTLKSKPYYLRSENAVSTSFGTGWAAYSCNHCEAMSVGVVYINTQSYHDASSDQVAREFQRSQNVLWLPERPRGKEFPDVPEQIAQTASEAYQSFNIKAYRGAVMLARAVVEATCKGMGVTKGNLESKIDELKNQALLRPGTAALAHEIRHFGNDMAHGDFVGDIDPEDCESTLTLMGEVLNEVYQNPARLARAKAARDARKQANSPE